MKSVSIKHVPLFLTHARFLVCLEFSQHYIRFAWQMIFVKCSLISMFIILSIICNLYVYLSSIHLLHACNVMGQNSDPMKNDTKKTIFYYLLLFIYGFSLFEFYCYWLLLLLRFCAFVVRVANAFNFYDTH